VWFASDCWWSLRREQPKLQVDRAYLKVLIAATIPFSIATIVNTLYFRADGFLLSIMRDSSQVGLYSLGYKVVELTAAFPLFFAMAILPILSATTDRDKFAQAVRRSTKVLTLLGAAVTLGVIALAPEVTILLGGPGFQAAAVPLTILMVGNYLIYHSTVYMQSLLASDNQKSILKINVALLAVNVAINLGLIPFLGSVGAASAVVVSEILALLMLRGFFKRHLGEPLRWSTALKPLVPGVVMVAAIMLLKGLLERWGANDIAVIGICVLVGGGIFVAGAWLTKLFSVTDIRALLRPRGEES
jgi:O-antigen/teichoic acid export membrane protein